MRVVGKLGEVPYLLPVKDSLTVWHRIRQLTRTRAGRDEQHVVVDGRGIRADFSHDLDDTWGRDACLAVPHLHTVSNEALGDITRLCRRELSHSVEHELQVDTRRARVNCVAVDPHTQVRALASEARRARGRHERLAWDAVGEHCGATDSVTLDQDNVGAFLSRYCAAS